MGETQNKFCMKLLFYSILIIATANFSDCKKQKNRPAGFIENRRVAVNACTPFVQNGVNYSICLDSVIDESRCPVGGQCIWEGYAKAKFTFTAGASAHQFLLYTTVPGGGRTYPNDTVINGIKLQLKAITPYPDLKVERNYNDYKADVVISQQ